MDRLDAMEAFVVTVESGSLSRAARALGRSIAAVSRALSGLEARLGAPLLRRTTRSLKLTEAGERYLAVCRRVLADLAAAESATSLGTPRGALSVTAPVMFGALHVRPVVAQYLATYPEMRVRLSLLDRVVNVVDEGIDVAVRIGHLPDSSLVATTVGTVRRIVCASPSYVAAHGRPAAPRDLAVHRCIGFSPLVPSDTWAFGAGPEGGRATRVKVQPVLTVNTAEAALASALDGMGITCALSYQAAEALRRGGLVALLTAYEPEAIPVQLVYPAGSTTVPKVRAFVETAAPHLRAALTGPPRRKGPRPS